MGRSLNNTMNLDKILEAALASSPTVAALIVVVVLFLRDRASERKEWMALIGTILAQLPTAADAANENTAAANKNTNALDRNTRAIRERPHDRAESETAG